MMLSKVDIFIKRLFGSSKLRGYELICLEAWKKMLSKDALDILNMQIKAYDLVQRLSNDKLVCFHYLKDSSYESWSDRMFFPLRGEGKVVATMTLRAAREGQRTSLKVDITFSRGRLFSIEFNRPPKTLFSKREDPSNIEVTDVSVLINPMVAGVDVTEMIADAGNLTGWLRDWIREWKVQNLRKPLPVGRRENILGQLNARLPADYLDLISQTEGLHIENCVVYGLSEIRKLVLPNSIVSPDMNLLVLADVEGHGSVGVKENGKDSVVYYLDNEDERPEAVGNSFRVAIEQKLTK